MRRFVCDLFGIDPATAADAQERTKDIRLACTLGFPVSIFFAGFNACTGFMGLGLVEAVSALVLLPPAYILAASEEKLTMAETLVMLCVIAINAALYHFGGVHDTGIYWIFSVPFVAFYVSGQRRGWLWSLGFFILLLFLPPAPGFTYTQKTHFELALFFYAVIAASFNMLRVRFEAKLDTQVKENTAAARRYLERLLFLAKHDDLTGLPNREGILALLDEEIKRPQEGDAVLVAMYIKLVRVVELVNIIGMEQGALLFAEIVEKMKNALQCSGRAGRLGRDEFIFFFRCQDKELEDSSWLLSLFGAGFECSVAGQTVTIEYVAGVCVHGDEPEAEILLRKAEQAMLAARASQCDFFVYNADNDRHFTCHHLLFGKLREALRKNHLEMHYQPKIDLATGRPTGAEALARWTDPEEGVIPPVLFVPVAEQSGLILPLTRWAISTAIAQCAEWRQAGLDIGISINLSARNLADAGLIGHLENTAAAFQVPPAMITMELTEGVFLDISKKSTEVIRCMREKGFRISIDDYGTGYSSLSYIKGLPVSELKIDQSFIRGIMETRCDALIVRSTIDMARQLGLSVVAEGVEDADIGEQLRQFGCQVGQGYYFGRPMPGAVFIDWAQAALRGREKG